MFRPSTSICPFCEVRALFQPWQQYRTAATLQKRKPSRMTLSPNVGRAPPRPAPSGKPMLKRTRNSPFGGMNVREAPRRLQIDQRNTVSAAEQKRAFKHSKGPKERERRDPMKALKMQRALSNVSYESRSRVKQALLEKDTFEEFDLLPVVRESVAAQALGGMVSVSPTPIQRLAIPALLGMEEGRRRRKRDEVPAKKEMQQFLLAAETGSGKTLAYVLPVVDALKRAEIAETEHDQSEAVRQKAVEQKAREQRLFDLPPPDVEEPHPTTGRPRAIILVPTSELVVQVGALVKSLSHAVKFRAALISATYSSTIIRNRLFSPSGIDIVVCTPHLLNSITESDPNLLSRVTHLVIDEADSLLDRSFSPITSSIVDRVTPSLKQLILCSATIPRSLDSYLQKRFPEVKRLVTPNLHAIPRRVQLSVVDIEKVPYQGNRDLACAQTIWDIGKEAAEQEEEREKEEKVVVFVNEREKATELAEYLRAKGIDATGLSRDSDERKQAEVLAAFTGAKIPVSQKYTALLKANAISHADLTHSNLKSFPSATRQLKNTKVLVMTDLGSRGIDTLPVKHVILYDVPHTSIDFIHRLGRVGRMGRRGRGIVLVGRHDRKDVVKEVREGMFKGQALI